MQTHYKEFFSGVGENTWLVDIWLRGEGTKIVTGRIFFKNAPINPLAQPNPLAGIYPSLFFKISPQVRPQNFLAGTLFQVVILKKSFLGSVFRNSRLIRALRDRPSTMWGGVERFLNKIKKNFSPPYGFLSTFRLRQALTFNYLQSKDFSSDSMKYTRIFSQKSLWSVYGWVILSILLISV